MISLTQLFFERPYKKVNFLPEIPHQKGKLTSCLWHILPTTIIVRVRYASSISCQIIMTSPDHLTDRLTDNSIPFPAALKATCWLHNYFISLSLSRHPLLREALLLCFESSIKNTQHCNKWNWWLPVFRDGYSFSWVFLRTRHDLRLSLIDGTRHVR